MYACTHTVFRIYVKNITVAYGYVRVIYLYQGVFSAQGGSAGGHSATYQQPTTV